MRVHHCPDCDGPLYFDNLACGCGTWVAYDPEVDAFLTLRDAAACANRGSIACNWRAPEPGALCRSCAMTSVIPDLAVPGNTQLWHEAEGAKRWVLADLARWGWFTDRDPGRRPDFRLLAEATRRGDAEVTMGHADGVLTINIAEADPAEREARRQNLHESYRTMTGHFRHELGHFLFERIAADPGFPDAFRALFGDERADYGEALRRHYENGPPPDWQQRHVSAYASSHPHEDWAESVAHLLHLVDIVDSAAAAELAVDEVALPIDAYSVGDAEQVITAGATLAIALTHVNRAMGLPDLYPFVLTPAARDKLAFVHGRLRRGPGSA